MNKTIIGSTAIKHWIPDFRSPKDTDYLYSGLEFKSEVIDGNIVEWIPAPDWWVYKEFATLTEILTLKASHVFWTPRSRKKHLSDIEFLNRLGYSIDSDMFWDLYKHWDSLYGKRSQSDQNTGVDKFFDDLLTRERHHDEIHLIINPNPVYKKILVGDGTVNISESLFNALSFEEKLEVIREEVYVLSYERWSKRSNSPKYNYRQNLEYFLCHLAPTWLSLFGMINLNTLSEPKINYKEIIDSQSSK